MTSKAKKIPFSILELAVISKGNSTKETFENSLDLAQKGEEFGYERFWLAEHHNSVSIASSATSVLIGYIAGGTKRIKVGSGGIMLPNHSPLIVAEQFGTLGSLYPNRIELGLGRAPGTDQVTAHAIRPDRMQSVYRFPDEVKEIIQYFSFENKDAKVRATVAEGVAVPLYILGSSIDSARLAAKMGLPYAFASHFAPAQFFDALDIYNNDFQPSEFLKEPYIIGAVNIIAADTDAEAERISTSLIIMIISFFTGKRDLLQEPTEMTQDLQEILQHPNLQQMLKFTFIGSKETVKQKTKDFITKTDVNEIMAVSHIYDHAERVNSFRIFSEVMKEINGEA